MPEIDTIARLHDYDAEDIFDVIVKLEKSFGLEFDKEAFLHVNTFGDLCEVFDNYINAREQREDCITQQAFYRIRSAITSVLPINIDNIYPETRLEDLFPVDSRRKDAKLFKKEVRVNVRLLTYPGWLALCFVAGIVLSFATLFYDWRVALGGLAFFVGAIKVAETFGRTLVVETVGQLAEKMAREHYTESRRNKGTVNRKEVTQLIINTFSEDLAIEKAYLTKATKFSWTNEPAKQGH
ncbi:MAG: hypothetical protein ACK4E0_15795 [Chitinophagaceae bacterium]